MSYHDWADPYDDPYNDRRGYEHTQLGPEANIDPRWHRALHPHDEERGYASYQQELDFQRLRMEDDLWENWQSGSATINDTFGNLAADTPPARFSKPTPPAPRPRPAPIQPHDHDDMCFQVFAACAAIEAIDRQYLASFQGLTDQLTASDAIGLLQQLREADRQIAFAGKRPYNCIPPEFIPPDTGVWTQHRVTRATRRISILEESLGPIAHPSPPEPPKPAPRTISVIARWQIILVVMMIVYLGAVLVYLNSG